MVHILLRMGERTIEGCEYPQLFGYFSSNFCIIEPPFPSPFLLASSMSEHLWFLTAPILLHAFP